MSPADKVLLNSAYGKTGEHKCPDELAQLIYNNKFNRPRDVKTVAAEFRRMIAWEARRSGLTVCDLEAEILAQSLMSDDCDQCHVHWLELHSKLEEKLQNASS